MTVLPVVDTTVACSSAEEVAALSGNGVHVPIGVSRSFILSYTGIAEPSDKECPEGSHSVWKNMIV